MNKFEIVKNKVVVGITAALMLGMVVAPSAASAQANVRNNDVFGINDIEGDGTPGNGIALGQSSLQATAVRLINVALSLLGIIAVVIVLIGGFKWMTAGGNDDKIAEARKLIFAGIVGMAIILSAWAIAKFVLSNLASATDVQGADNLVNDGAAEPAAP